MAPRPGGEADKAGNRYEYLWIINSLLDVVQGKADRIYLEPIGPEGRGIEFRVDIADRREYHQAKRSAGTGKQWSLSRLNVENVLRVFRAKLRDPQASCIFVSGSAADELQMLCERALGITSSAELECDAEKCGFGTLRNYWDDSPESEALEALRRIRVEHWPEGNLRRHVHARIAPLIDGDEETACSVLRDLVEEAIDKGKTLTAQQIWNHLHNNGIGRSEWWKDKDKLALFDAATKRYIQRLKRETIGDTPISRQEVGEILEKLSQEQGKRVVLAEGEGGAGKSGVLLQVVEAVRERGWPVLAIRLDELKEVLYTEEVGESLVRMAKSPAKILAAVAQNDDCLLVIDQLDAVSHASGRHPANYEVVYEILQQAPSYPNMRVLLACRMFDIQNDTRLLALRKDLADPVSIGCFPEETAREVLGRLGYVQAALTEKRMQLLRLPLHLRILEQITTADGSMELDFETDTDLYEEFWKVKQRAIGKRFGDQQFVEVIDVLADYVSDNQTLAVPENALVGCKACAEVMASEHVLVLNNGKYSFFHEGFFDYVFAYRFAGRGRDLLKLLKQSEQHLFRRAQVRQILLYERKVQFKQYIANLGALLTDAEIRQHIKEIVYGILSAVPDPQQEEWGVLSKFLTGGTGSQTPGVWKVVGKSEAWFALLDSLGVIEQWLASDDRATVLNTLWWLTRVQSLIPDRVAELLEPYTADLDRHHNELAYVLRYSDVGASDRYFRLFTKLVNAGFYDEEPASHEFWVILSSIADTRAEKTCAALAAWFDRLREQAERNGQPNPFDEGTGTIVDDQQNDNVLTKCASNAPEKFVAWALPFVLKVADATADKVGEPLWIDRVWGYRTSGMLHHVCEHLLAALEMALALLAADKPEVFAEYAALLRYSSLETAQFVLVKSYTSGGNAYADDIVDLLCEQPARLGLCYIDRACGPADGALKIATRHCSEGNLLKLEDVMLNYFPRWEWNLREEKYTGNYRGITQFRLLQNIPEHRRSTRVRQRLRELSRKFNLKVDAPEEDGPTSGWVGSPIPGAAAAKMTDEQWIRAIRRYSTDATCVRNGRLIGGAHQLSSLLEQQAKQDPRRFVELALKIPKDAHPYYYNAILRAAEGAELSTDYVARLCRHCHAIPGHPCGRWITQPIAAIADRDLPVELLDIVSWYATEHPHPEQAWRSSDDESDDSDRSFDNLYTAGINSVRGSAVESLGRLVFEKGDRLERLRPVFEQVVQDPSLAVRTCAAHALLGVLRHDRNLVVDLFLRLAEADDTLLGSGPVELFISYAVRTHFVELERVLRRMLLSEKARVATVGARQACFAALCGTVAAVPLAEECLSGSEAARTGAALAHTEGIRWADSREACTSALIRLCNDPSSKVRSEASACFNRMEGSDVAGHLGLARAFVSSAAFIDHYSYLIGALERASVDVPDVTLAAGKRFFSLVGSDAGDVTKQASYDAGELSRVVIRLYSNAQDETTQTRCLDLIDRMLPLNVWRLEELLDSCARCSHRSSELDERI